MTNFEKWKAELTKEGAAEFVKTGSKVCMACPAIKFCYHGMENINKPCSEVFGLYPVRYTQLSGVP